MNESSSTEFSESGIFKHIISSENLELAFKKARKGKTLKPYVVEFERNLLENLLALHSELASYTYKPKPLETFILRDPKTRKISKSDFRDRVVHHAICNAIEPLFEKGFIYDSYANRLGKGSLKAIERFDYFKRKVSKNNTKVCYVLKADIKHYFETVDHAVLLSLLKKKVSDARVLRLIKVILDNYKINEVGKGMPLGNLTSQFFANVYLNELDQFVKHNLRAVCYLRYVDDFAILHSSKSALEEYKNKIIAFLKEQLLLELHPDKSRILALDNGIGFLGFRIFFSHKLIMKKNLNKFEKKFNILRQWYREGRISREKVIECFEGWLAYVSHADTFKYRRDITSLFNDYFPLKPLATITNATIHENILKKTEGSRIQFSSHKTLQQFKKGKSIKDIAAARGIKESTVWGHFAKLIEYNQCSVWKIFPKEKILKILPFIRDESDRLTYIKERLNDTSITFDEIACVLSHIKCKNKRKKRLMQYANRRHTKKR